jgi:hypothetical protein
MSKFVKLTDYHTSQAVLINADQVSIVFVNEQGQTIVNLINGNVIVAEDYGTVTSELISQ